MNDNRRFLATQEPLLALLKLGMPNKLIEGYFNLSETTIFNYIKKLRAAGQWSTEGISINQARPEMLKLLALAKSRKNDYKQLIDSSLNGDRLIEMLTAHFEVDRIIEILDYSSYHISTLHNFGFSADVPQSYQNFFRALSNIEPQRCGQILWSNYLYYISNGKIPLPEPKEISHDYHVMIDHILAEFTLETRRDVMPFFDASICEQVNQKLLTTGYPSEKSVEIVRHWYGLDRERLTLEMIGEKFDLTRERVRQIKEKTMKMIKRRLPDIMALPLNPDNIARLIASELRRHTQVLKTSSNPAKHPIIEVDFSARAFNILRAAGIEFMEDLAEFSRQDLFKFRHMGKKTMTEIEAALSALGLSLRPSVR